MAARGLGHVLDQYVDPPSRHRETRAIGRVFVPLLAGDAQAAGVVAALAEGVRARGRACSLRARDPRGAALLPPCSSGSVAAGGLLLEVGVEPPESAGDALLLLLLSGWEARAALGAAGQRPRSGPTVLLIGFGEVLDGPEPSWSVAGPGPAPICLGQLPLGSGLRGALGLTRARDEQALEAVARRLCDLAYPR